MKKIFFLLCCSLLMMNKTFAQMIVANPPQPIAPFVMFSVVSPQATPKGVLLTPMSVAQRDQITKNSAPDGLLVYNTTEQSFNVLKSGNWTVMADTNRVKTMLDLKATSLLSLINLAEQNAKAYTDTKVVYLNGRIDSVKVNHGALLSNFNMLSSNVGVLSSSVSNLTNNFNTLNSTVNTTLPNLQTQVNNAWSTSGNNVASGAFIGTNEPFVIKQENVQIAKISKNSMMFGENANAGNQSIAIGGGANAKSSSVSIGSFTGSQSITSSVAIGDGALNGISVFGTSNVAVGIGALRNGSIQATNDAFKNSSAFGFAAGAYMKGESNSVFGLSAGQNLEGTNNLILGIQAGLNATGSNNIILGNSAAANKTISNSVIIGGSGSDGTNIIQIGTGSLTSPSHSVTIGNPQIDSTMLQGTVKVSKIKITSGSPTQGKVLTATDNQGNATWSTPNAGWGLNGNAGTDPNVNFIGTTDNKDIVFRRGGIIAGRVQGVSGSTSYGQEALALNTSYWNAAFGLSTLGSNTSGKYNSGYGAYCAAGNINGDGNSAFGFQALKSSQSTSYTSAFGAWAGEKSSGNNNTFLGAGADVDVQGATYNNSTAIGYGAKIGASDVIVLGTASNKIGIGTSIPTEKLEVVGGKTKVETIQITANNPTQGKVLTATDNQGNATWSTPNTGWGLNGNVDATNDSYLGTPGGGAQSLNFKVDGRIAGRIESQGFVSTSYGVGSLQQEATGFWNSAFGDYSLSGNTSGNSNSAFGSRSLAVNNGVGNSAFGVMSLINNMSGSESSAFGSNAGSNSLGSGNSFFGAGTNASTLTPNISSATAVGFGAIVDASNKIRFGDDNITSISYAVNASISSDRRLKKDIRNSILGLAFIKKLQTVDYEYIAEGQKGIRYTGFVAQDVETAAIESGTRDWSGLDKSSLPSGGHYALRYAEFVVPLTKAIQEQQTIIETQEKKIADLEKENEALKRRMEKIEKMLLEMKK